MKATALPVVAQQALAQAVLLLPQLVCVQFVHRATVARPREVQPDARFVLKAPTVLLLRGMKTPVYHATQDTAPRAKELLDLMLPLVQYVHWATVAQVAPLLV
jgi:hypothetical protein